jgi:SecD/SecF fusion protein
MDETDDALLTSGDPAVTVDLAPRGQHAFTTLTRELAQRGRPDGGRSSDPLRTAQHLALVIDNRIMSTPYINWREAPDGIDGTRGASISVPTPEQARVTAALLSAGPLPSSLQLQG